VTYLELDIGNVVLRGLPSTYGATFGALVEQRIGAIAHGETTDPDRQDLDGEQGLADQVARQVWDEVRRSTEGAWGERL
jgi:hypothetical protein